MVFELKERICKSNSVNSYFVVYRAVFVRWFEVDANFGTFEREAVASADFY